MTLVCVHGGLSQVPSVTQTNSSVKQFPEVPLPKEQSKKYNLLHYVLYAVSIPWSLTGLVIIINSPINRKVVEVVRKHLKRPAIQTSVYVAIYTLWTTIWSMPIGLTSYFIERSYGFAVHSPLLWLSDRFIGYLFELTAIPAVIFGYWLLKRSPKHWWAWLWAASIPWQLLSIVLWPVFVAPRYNTFIPLKNAELKQKLLVEANAAGLINPDVYQVDISRRTTKLNAYVSGIGPSRRIVIWDTMLKSMSDDEIMAIMGHELGHAVIGHLWWRLAAGILGAGIILFGLSKLLPYVFARFGKRFGYNGVLDLAGFPLVMLILFCVMIIQQPVECAISRYQEHQADEFGLKLTGKKIATATAFLKFVDKDFADTDPPTWIVFMTYSHPPIRERIQFAKDFLPVACCKGE